MVCIHLMCFVTPKLFLIRHCLFISVSARVIFLVLLIMGITATYHSILQLMQVLMRKEHALQLEQEALKEEDEDNVEDYHHLGDDSE